MLAGRISGRIVTRSSGPQCPRWRRLCENTDPTRVDENGRRERFTGRESNRPPPASLSTSTGGLGVPCYPYSRSYSHSYSGTGNHRREPSSFPLIFRRNLVPGPFPDGVYPTSSPLIGSVAAGRRKTTVVPWPGSDVICMSPPWRRTTLRTTVSPRPAAPASVLVVKNGSNIRS